MEKSYERVVYDRGGGRFEINSAGLVKVQPLSDGLYLNEVKIYGRR